MAAAGAFTMIARPLLRSPTVYGVESGRGHVLRRSIHIFRDVADVRRRRRGLQQGGETVGLVPTMGALHEGHMSLVRAAARENSSVFVSIYVNPTQFGLHEDLDSYPKTWESDMAKLHELQKELKVTQKETGQGYGRIEAVFAPTTKTMYPTTPPDSSIPGQGSFVTITPLGNLLEGKSRPVFFRGVATVCMKLFNIVQADRVYFGQKDVQQTVVIRRLVEDFHLGCEVRILPTEREASGLARSSRNAYLGSRRREAGLVLYKALDKARQAYHEGATKRNDVLTHAWAEINARQQAQEVKPPTERAMFEVDYVSLADPDTMEEVDNVDVSKGAVLSGAIKMLPLEATREGEMLGLGDDKVPVRLIDNFILPAR